LSPCSTTTFGFVSVHEVPVCIVIWCWCSETLQYPWILSVRWCSSSSRKRRIFLWHDYNKSPCNLVTLKWIFGIWNVTSSVSGVQSSAGKVFQSQGLATVKLMLLSRVFVRGMVDVLTSADHSVV